MHHCINGVELCSQCGDCMDGSGPTAPDPAACFGCGEEIYDGQVWYDMLGKMLCIWCVDWFIARNHAAVICDIALLFGMAAAEIEADLEEWIDNYKYDTRRSRL